jgi:hypothetical protein
MYDNAPTHNAKATKQDLLSKAITPLPYPTTSLLDINPIKNVWKW